MKTRLHFRSPKNKLRGFFIALCGLSYFGCQTPKQPWVAPGMTGMPVNSPRAFMTLADGSIHLAAEGEPSGLYVKGVVEAGRFVPEGEILGEGQLAAEGAAGWLELLDGNFYSEEAGREPMRPYVEGAMDIDGVFRPTTRRVVY